MNIDDFSTSFNMGINMPSLSASTINSFIERRESWYKSKVLNEPFVTNEYMARGSAVEHAINEWLKGESPESLLDHAKEKYRAEMSKVIALRSKRGNPYVESKDEIFDSLAGLVEHAFGVFSDVFKDEKPTSQEKIQCNLPGVDIPIIGYLDYSRRRIIDDCKVSSKTPSKLSQGYIIQGALYKYATGKDVIFDFIVANKKPTSTRIMLTEENYRFGLAYATKAAQTLQELQVCDNPRRVMELMCFPNLASFFTESDKVEAAKTIGLEI